MEIKIGDRVKFVKSIKEHTRFCVGDVLVVKAFDEDYNYHCSDGEFVGFFLQEEIEPVESAKNKKRSNNMKVFESPNREKYLGDLYFGDYFKFMSGAFKGSFGIVCGCTENANNCMKDEEDFEEKIPCLIFTDDIPFPVFSIEDTSTEIKKLSGKTIFEED